MATPLVHEHTEYAVVESEPPELLASNLRVGSYLWSSATIFFFVGFLFAFFYLRVLNNADLWRPKGVSPPVGLGTAVLVTMALSLGAALLARRERRAAGSPPDQARLRTWRLLGLLALVLALVAVVLQVVAYVTLGFGPSSGGYASVYVAWTGMFALFVLGGCFWLETLLATSFRYRKTTTIAPGQASGDAYRSAHDVSEPLALVLPGLEAFVFYWMVLGVIEVVTYILLYVIR